MRAGGRKRRSEKSRAASVLSSTTPNPSLLAWATRLGLSATTRISSVAMLWEPPASIAPRAGRVPFGGKAEVGVSAAGAAARNLAERRCQDYGNSHRYQKGPSARDAANTLSATLLLDQPHRSAAPKLPTGIRPMGHGGPCGPSCCP